MTTTHVSRPFLVAAIALVVASTTSTLAGQQLALSEPIGDDELPNAVPSPFEASGRSQQFISRSEFGLAAGAPFVMNGIALRFDGPSTSAGGAAHVLTSLRVRVGATAHSIQEIGAEFEDNLTQPLVTAFLASNYVMPVDVLATTQPQPWGGPGDALHLTFPTPVRLTIPNGGCLVVEFEVVADPSHTPAATQLDFARTNAPGALPGTSIAEGQGCAYPMTMPLPQLFTHGEYDVGTSFSVSGEGFPSSVPVITWWTALLSAPTILPGTPGCWSYLDFASGGVMSISLSTPAGTIGGEPPVPIPPAPGLTGSLLYLQSAGLTPAMPLNPTGIVTSNYRTIRVGHRAPAKTVGWYITRRGSPTAMVAETSIGGGLALRIE